MSGIQLAIEHRISALERQNRRMRAWCGVMGVIAVAPMLLAAQRGPDQDVVRTTRLDIVRNGATVASIGGDAEGGALMLFRPGSSNPIVSLTGNSEGGQIMVFQPGGQRAAGLLSFDTGGSLDISDRAGKTVGYFDAKATGAYLSLKNSSYNEVFRIRVTEAQAGGADAWDRTDRRIFSAP